MFSVFHEVYEFQRREPQSEGAALDSCVQSEIICFIALAPFLQADMERDFLPLITTCDASPSYGFGVSVHACSDNLIRDLAELSENHDHYLRTNDPTDGERPRCGTPVRLPFDMDSFTDVLSIKARSINHSGAMEAHALLLLIKWLLRVKARFNSRVVVGIDAQVILHAAAKGRTSAPTLQHIFRSIAAHCLVGGLMLYPSTCRWRVTRPTPRVAGGGGGQHVDGLQNPMGLATSRSMSCGCSGSPSVCSEPIAWTVPPELYLKCCV